MLQDRKDVARRGRIVAVFAEFDAEPLGHLVGGHRSRDEQAAVVALDDEGFAADILVRREFAGDRRQKVGGRDQPVEMAIFVVDEQHRHFGDAQRLERVHRVDLVVDDFGGAHQLFEVERLALKQRRGDIARLHHPHDVVDRPARDGQAAVRGFEQFVAHPARVESGIDPVHVLARRHHLAHRTVGKAHDARNDRALAFLDHPRFRRLGDDQVEFLGRHAIFRFAVEAEQAEHQRRTVVEQPDERRRDTRQPVHRNRHEYRDPLGRAQRELLRHQLARDQREIGGKRNDRRKARRLGVFGIEAKPCREPVGYRLAEAGTRIGAGQHADQRDSNLHRRQEAAGIGSELARDLRAAAAALLGRLKARVARRNDREFGHGENAVEEDEDRDDRDVGPRERGHWAVVQRVGAWPLSSSVISTL